MQCGCNVMYVAGRIGCEAAQDGREGPGTRGTPIGGMAADAAPRPIEGHVSDTDHEGGQWLLVRDAAGALGISENTLRTRMSRDPHQRKYRRQHGNDGRVYIWVGDEQVVEPLPAAPEPEPPAP